MTLIKLDFLPISGIRSLFKEIHIHIDISQNYHLAALREVGLAPEFRANPNVA